MGFSDFFLFSHHLSMVGLPPRCPQVVWCHGGEIEPFSVTLAQDGLTKCDQPEIKSFEILRRGWELNPGHREDRQ